MIGGVIVAVAAVGAAVLYPQLHSGTISPVNPPGLGLLGPAPTIDPAHPFRGSPAADYDSGAAGVKLPPAHAEGGFNAREVDNALKLAKRYFIAADLEPATVTGKSADAVLRLLDPQGSRGRLEEALRTPATISPLLWLSRFKPDETALATTTIKVRGTTTYGVQSNKLVVHMDYLVVYAVRRANPANHEVTRVIVHHIFEFSTYHGRRTTPNTVWLNPRGEESTGTRCSDRDGYLHPEYESDRANGGSARGPRIDPYDQSHPIPKDDACHSATRI